MSWSVSKIGEVSAVKAELNADVAANSLGNTQEATEAVQYLNAELDKIAAHPGIGVKVEANGHSYMSGNHHHHETTISVKTIALAKHPAT